MGERDLSFLVEATRLLSESLEVQSSRLAEEEAEAARAEAEDARLAKVRFLSTMSHELQTPLNAIAGYAELLATGIRGSLSEVQLADLGRIQANQRHLLGLVESVLTYAKIDAGRIEFGLGDVPLASLLAEVHNTMAPLISEKGATCLGCEAKGASDVTVYADASRLRQILINLLANAIKFSGEGGRIEITQRLAGSNVGIRVSDDGIGRIVGRGGCGSPREISAPGQGRYRSCSRGRRLPPN